MQLALPALGSALGSAAFSGTALAAYGASIGWVAGSKIGASIGAPSVRRAPAIDFPTKKDTHDDSQCPP